MIDKKRVAKELQMTLSQKKALNSIEESGRREIFSVKKRATYLFIEAVNCHTRVIARYTVSRRGKIIEIKEA
jgi:hypothetical protein